MDGESKALKTDIELYERSSCMLKDVPKRDFAVQTDNYNIKEVIAAIVNKRINQVQSFTTEELQRKLEKVEEENKNLRRRERIYEKRLVQLEEQSRKRRNVDPSTSPGAKRPYEDNATIKIPDENNENSNPENDSACNENSHEILDGDFCPPLFRSGQKKSHTISYQKEKIPTQLVTPMQKEAKIDSQVPVQKAVAQSVAHSEAHSEAQATARPVTSQLQQVRTNEAFRRADLQVQPNRQIEASTMQLQHVPVQLVAAPVMNTRQYIRYPVIPQRAINPNQGARFARIPLRGPPPNHNLFEYRPLSKLNHHQRIPTYQIRAIPSHEMQMQQQPQTVHYTAVSTNPPPPYKEPSNFIPLPRLTASITSDASSIILTWDCFDATSQFQRNVDVYFLFAFHTLDLSKPPPTDVNAWKRIGAIKSLPLPIACTLTQTFDGHNYFFAVVATGAQGRMGELSNPCALKVTL